MHQLRQQSGDALTQLVCRLRMYVRTYVAKIDKIRSYQRIECA